MGGLSTSGFVRFPRRDRNIDRLTLAAYPVVATTLKLRSARWCYTTKNIIDWKSSLARPMVPNDMLYFSTLGVQGWVQIFL